MYLPGISKSPFITLVAYVALMHATHADLPSKAKCSLGSSEAATSTKWTVQGMGGTPVSLAVF